MNRRILLAGTLAISAMICGVLASTSTPANAQEEPAPTSDKTTTTGSPEREVSKRIDAEIKKVWDRDGIKPAKQSSDEEFVRRVYLDTVGLPPTPDEVVAFTKDKDEEKRRKLVAKLVDDERFGRYISDRWTNILLGRSGRDYGGSSALFGVWLSERINQGDAFKDVMYDIITASGSVSENPAVAVYTRDPNFSLANAAGTLSKNLTGVQIQCAQCHDHPYEESWTEEVFMGVASFWAGVQVRTNNRVLPVDPTVQDGGRAARMPNEEAMAKLPPQAQARIKEAARFNKPVTLDGNAVKTTDRRFWRPAYAKWMVNDENHQTANYVANRFWSFTFGTGILNPIDDFNSFNEASHPELLEYLGQDLIDNDYDIKRLYRAILNSNTYQLSSTNAPKKGEQWHFASAPVRQMTPEQFFGTFIQIAGGDNLARTLRQRKGTPADQFKRRIEGRMKKMEKEKDDPNARQYEYNEETVERLGEWYDKMDDGWFIRRSMAQNYAKLSSDDEMNEVDGFSLTIDQALLVMNGDVTNNLSGSRRGSTVWKLMNQMKDDGKRIEALYLKVLGRTPTKTEVISMKKYVKETKNAAAAYEDIMFALLASTEFATNH